MKSYVVIGLGRFGGETARRLCELGGEVLAMDTRGDLVQQVSACVTQAVVGDAQDKEVLRALGVQDFDCAIVAIGGDLGASVLVTMNLKGLGVPYIVCKAMMKPTAACWKNLARIRLSFLKKRMPIDWPGV